ncbi:MAG: hypothetical protein ABW186_06710 [Rhodanobacteraceae bacterium]
MTEFEIQRNLRAMNAPREPEHDLWPAIAARIGASMETSAPRATRRRWIPLAAAAGTVFAIVGGLAFFALKDRVETSADNDYAMTTHIERISPAQAREQALRSGEDPRLAGSNIVLDAAHSELQQALEQHPDAVFLVSLLNRTNAQRMKLEQFGAKAG